MNKKWLVAALLCISGSLALIAGPRPGSNGREKQAALDWLKENESGMVDWCTRIWEFAEVAMQERQSCELLASALEGEGFRVTRSAGGMDTAFVASYGTGEPVIGILAEYDALPGISQKIAAEKEPLAPGGAGHGCGHNLYGAGSTAAAIAVKRAMEAFHIPGTIRLYGCPAEETVYGKTAMARAGLFSGLSAAVSWHPGAKNRVSLDSSQALNNFKVAFQGQSAHAAGDPWNGRSALDAIELLNVGINYWREHIPPTARIHYVTTVGGKAPNVVPDFAEGWYYVREKDRPSTEKLYLHVLDIVKGAALMTGTQYRVEMITGVHNLLPNRAGSRVMYENLSRVGPPRFTPEEQAFAQKLQEAFGKEKKGLSDRVEPFTEKAEFSGGSTDVAEVSRIAPTVQVNTVCWPQDIPGHSWGIVACSGHPIGFKGTRIAAAVMAMTVIDFLKDEKLLVAMREELRKETGNQPYRSPLAGQ